MALSVKLPVTAFSDRLWARPHIFTEMLLYPLGSSLLLFKVDAVLTSQGSARLPTSVSLPRAEDVRKEHRPFLSLLQVSHGCCWFW